MNVVHDPISNMLFREGKNGYSPYAINYNEETGQAKLIHKTQILMEIVNYVYFVRRQQDKQTGKFRFLPLFPYQWAFIFKYVNAVLYEKSTKYLEAYARQSGRICRPEPNMGIGVDYENGIKQGGFKMLI